MFKNIKSKINTLLNQSYNFYAAYSVVCFVVIMTIAITIGLVGRQRYINETKDQMERSVVRVAERVATSLELYAAKIKKLTTWFDQIGNPELNFDLTRDQAAVVLSMNMGGYLPSLFSMIAIRLIRPLEWYL